MTLEKTVELVGRMFVAYMVLAETRGELYVDMVRERWNAWYLRKRGDVNR